MSACWFLGRIVLSCRTTSLAALALLLSAAIPFAAAAPLVSVVDPATPVYGPNDVSAPAANQLLRLSGPRNGVCSAQAVAVFPPATPLPAAGLQATLSPLRNGSATLPADKILIRYAAKEDHFDIGALDMRPGHTTHRFLEPYYDRLMATPPATASSPTTASLVPVWVTVAIPKDAQPGLYKGTLEIAGARVPVELRVSEWVCPNPNDWTTHVGVVPSAESEALHYGVKFWSPEHWVLIEKQMDLLAGVGCDDLWIPVADGGYGKGFPIVTFTRKAAVAGAAATVTTATQPSLQPDLANMRRYVELFAKKVGKPQFVLVYLWGDGPRDRSGQSAGTSMYVVADGKREAVPLPGSPVGRRTLGSRPRRHPRRSEGAGVARALYHVWLGERSAAHRRSRGRVQAHRAGSGLGHLDPWARRERTLAVQGR